MLKAVVIGLGALIVIALGAVALGIVAKFSAHRAAPSAAAQAFALPHGATVLEMQTLPNRVVLHLRTPAGEEVDIFDAADGRLVARIR